MDWEVGYKLIAAKSTAISIIWESLIDGFGDGFENQVAFVVTKCIVDVLEVVSVDEEDGTPLFLFNKPIKGRNHFFIEEDTIMDASQLIVVIELA